MSLYFKIIGYILGFVLILVGLAFWLKGYFAIGVEDSLQVPTVLISQNEEVEFEGFDLMDIPHYEVVEVLRDLFVPWSIVFVGEDRMLIAQRSGEILQAFPGDLIDSWQLSEEPLYSFEGVSNRSEEGLMGLALDPDFENNGFIYACVAYEEPRGMSIKIERLQDSSTVIVQRDTIFEGIPGARFHAGCRLRFGPDDKLYITTGDAAERNLAQDMNSLAGKILRINSDGSIPDDNSFEGSAVWSLGHRNAQGLDWHPESGILVSSEHGPSIFDGPAGGDEINIIVKGENYGWPIVSHERSDPRFVDPIIVMTPATAPASGVFYDGELFPEFYGNFFTGLLVGEGILRVVFDSAGQELVGYMKLPDINAGRIRDIAVGPDGAIYFASSNRDGRGRLNEGDDKIFKLVPVAE